MVFLIDPSNLKGKACPKLTCDIVCTLCSSQCGNRFVPLYGIPPEEE